MAEWALHCFKAYDIRGIAYDELDEKFAERLGKALGTFLDASNIAVGRDIRESSPSLHSAFVSGLTQAGVNVHDLGICTTGSLYHATSVLDVDGGVMITASHNPPEYNGFKMCRGTAAMAGKEIQDLKEAFDQGEFIIPENQGNHIILEDFVNGHLDSVMVATGTIDRPVHVVIDAANAVPGPFLVSMAEKLGTTGIAIHCEWDNTFPNHPPDPTRPKNMIDLSNAVISTNAEFGLGVDGDGDRIGVVDENGHFIHPDRLLAVFAADILSQIPNDATPQSRTVIHDVKCSMALEYTIRENGGIPHMMRTGHSFLKQALREMPECPLAGEMSGHFFFNDRWNGFDDALYGFSRLVELVARRLPNGEPFSSLFNDIPDFPSTGEAKVPLKGEREEIMVGVKNAFSDLETNHADGVRVRYDGNLGIESGWFLCRPSNTEPILVMRAEANSQQGLDTIRNDVEKRIGNIINLSLFHEA
ncbi:MAG: phosphomannomutase/phosphoglucomutase [Candidatus Thalassarchaeaceae archaeon]|nr:MAG: phosphomannomutase/phosphoglucomutase [Euryarchaeota archaeon]RPG75373.1 MAG: phosphomannomutase/phosphoglucomutase [Euryarchaeota archaeon TMED85]